MSEFENFKVKKNEFPTFDEDKKKEVLGRLLALEDLSVYIDTIRECYTRELVVNGVKPPPTEADKEAFIERQVSDPIPISNTISEDYEHRRASP
tara:strand:- start:40 stop:321 length:282 start_codon:yes stop_codon:yes gene_type:complete